MKINRKQILLALSTISIVATSALAIACSSTTNTSDEIPPFKADAVRNGDFTIVTSRPFSDSPWTFDASINFGDLPEGTENLGQNGTNATFVRTVNEGEPELQSSSQGGKSQNVYVKWSYEYWKFEYAAAIILTLSDNTMKTYDSDEVDAARPNGSADKPIVRLQSSNNKSINSRAFNDDLKNAKKLQIRFKDNQFYSDAQGNKTKYRVKPVDFWGSYKKVFMLTQAVRQANGGSQILDDKGVKLSPAGSLFSLNSNYSNDYLYSLFGIDVQQLLDEKTALVNDPLVENPEAPENAYKKLLTFTGFSGENDQHNFFGAWTKQIVDSSEFSPISLDYIKEVLNKKASNKDFTEGPDRATGDAERFGVYTWGKDWKDMLYAGYFYVSDVDSVNDKVVYSFNNNYANAAEEKAKPGYAKQVIRLNITSNSDQRIASEFILGNSFNVPNFGSLSDSERKRVQQNLDDNKNRRFAINFSRTSLQQGAFVLTNPSPRLGDGETMNDYQFNDNLAKLVYGKTRAEIARGGDTVTDFFSAKSIAFRAAIFAAINWQKFARQNNDNLQAWLGHIPPDGALNGSDAETAGFNTAKEKQAELNTKHVLHYDAATNSITGRDQVTSNDKDNKEVINQNASNDLEQYKSAAWKVAQAEIKNILDHQNLNGRTVEWTWVAPDRAKSNPREAEAIKNLQTTLNQLDSRLKITYNVLENQTVHDNATRKGTGYNVRGGWGNDYDGVGSAIDGLTHRERSIFLPFFSRALDAIGAFAWIHTNYPLIEGLAKELDAFIKNINSQPDSNIAKAIKIDKTKPIVDVSAWKNISNSDWSGFGAKDIVNPDHAINANQFALMGAFFANYQTKHTNEDLIKVVNELTEVIGFVPGRKEGSNLIKFTTPIRQAINRGRILPVSTSGLIHVQDLGLSQLALDAMKDSEQAN